MAQVSVFWLNLKAHLQAAAGWIAKTATISNFVALTWITLSAAIVLLIVQDLSRDVVTLEPISVPKALSDNGYTPEVASHRLRDALNRYATYNQPFGNIEDLNISARDELPDFVVPQIGLSLNAIVSSIRSVLHASGRTVSGEIVFHDKYALRVRVDGKQVYSSGFDADNPDELLAKAAPLVTEKLRPAITAAAEYRDNHAKGLLKADEIIARFDERNENVQWAWLLKGRHAFETSDFPQAEALFSKAVRLNWNSQAFHIELGRALERQGKFDAAIGQYKRVIALNPKSAVAYNNWGFTLVEQSLPDGPFDAAIAQFNRAIAADPRYLLARNNLGNALVRQRNLDAAIAVYRAGIEVEPKYLYFHWNLAAQLKEQNKLDEALAEYRVALDCTRAPRELANLHVSIGDVLKLKGGADLDGAIAEYRRAIDIDPAYSWAHNNLGLIWSDQGRLDDALAEFRKAAAAEPNNETLKENLDRALRSQEASASKESSAAKE